LKRRLLIATPVAIVAILLAAWILDSRAHDGEAMRNVEIAGRAVGGRGVEALEAVAEDVASGYADASVVIATPDGDIETDAAAIGLAVDVDATVERALDVGRDDPLPLRPLRWLTGLVSSREAGVDVSVDRGALRALVAEQDPTGRTEPVEPGITAEDGQLAVVLGEPGEGIDAESIADAIEAAASAGALPIRVEAEPGPLAPRFSPADAEALLEEAEPLSRAPLHVVAGETEATIPASTIRSWLRSTPGDDELELALDEDDALADLAELLPDTTSAPQDARFTVENGEPVLLEGVPGTGCCAPEAIGFILGAIRGGHAEDSDDAPVRLPLTEVEPDQTTEDLEALGIVEEIGSFTTRHKCCENRVSNIHRIADIVRGVVIEPGSRFSVNDFVGKRTTENGFVVDHVIENGSFSEAVGGGISQFATTLFNAAFFGGLDFVEYQSHSIYISRYPYGREATLSYPHPDLVLENTTPHGVLIWPTYDGTSITITLYSTKYAHGEQTAQSEAPVGQAGCKRVTTTRTRTYIDGHTEQDKVHAVYRPAEGVQCNGPPPTTTTTTTSTTAPPPEPSTTTTTTTTAPPG
jgi:vancomycin resistance protein YoaR